MRVALTAAAAALAVALIPLLATPVSANTPLPQPTTPPTTTTAPPATIRVVVSTPGQVEPGTPGAETGGTVAIPCSWSPDLRTQAYADELNETIAFIYDTINQWLGSNLTVVLTYYSEDGGLRAWDAVDQRFERRMEADCSNATAPGTWETGDLDWWVVAPPSPDILIPGAVAEAIAPILPPVPAINPPGVGTVNLGMWLAVEDTGPVTVRIELGPLWAEATAAVATTTFDLGDGPAIVCNGVGTPMPANARNAVDEGPCGHTFTDIDDVGRTQFTVTSRWSVTWLTSAGTSGGAPEVVQSTSIPYCVREIQTIGTERSSPQRSTAPGVCDGA